MQLIWLVVATFVGLLASESTLTRANPFKKSYGGDLKKLCDGQHVDFFNVGDLRNLIYLLDDPEASSKCSKTVVEALRSLDRITKDTKACSLEKAQALAEFYETFFRAQKGDAESEKFEEELYKKLPKPLIRFALAYGMKVSFICKKYMVNVFLKEADQKLTAEDFGELAEWTDAKGPIGRLLSSLKKPDEIVLPGDLSSVLPSGTAMAKLRLKMVDGGKVDRLQEVCNRRFRPLYENVLIPLAVLANSGLTYKELLFGFDLKLRSRVGPKVALWSRIVFLCESLDGVEVYDQSEPTDTGAPVTLASDEEPAAALEAQGLAANFQQLDTLYPKIKIKDEIMKQFDVRLKTLIRRFDKGKTYDERVKERLLGRGWSLLLARFKYGEFKSLMRGGLSLIKGALSKQKDNTQFLDKELGDLLEAKEETKLYRVLSAMERSEKTLGRKVAVLLVRIVVAVVVATIIVSGSNLDTVDKLSNQLKNY